MKTLKPLKNSVSDILIRLHNYMKYDYRIVSLQIAVFSIPFWQGISRVFQVLLILTFAVSYLIFKNSRRDMTHYLKSSSFLVTILYFFYVISFLLLAEDDRAGKFFLERMLLFCILPPVVSSFTLSVEDRRRIFKSFVISSLIACILCVFYAFYKSISIDQGEILFEPRIEIDPRIDFWTSINWGGNRFFSDQFSVFHHPTYFSIYILFSISLVVLVPNLFNKLPFRIAIVAFFVLTLFLLSARASLLTLFLLSLLLLGKNMTQFSGRKLAFISFILILSLSALFWFSPRFKEIKDRFLTEGVIADNSDKSSIGNRLLVWSASLSLIEDNLFQGVGVGNVDNKLKEIYNDRGYEQAFKQNLNCHNEYIQHTLMLGVSGLILILWIFGNAFFIGIRNNDYVLLSFIVIICLHALFESIFQRYSGVVFFAFFYPLLVSNSTINLSCNDSNN